MKSIILFQSSRLLFQLFIIISLIVLYRGHNLPGGGFIGGLLCASAFVLIAISDSTQAATRLLKMEPIRWIGVGLAVAFTSGIFGVFNEGDWMEALWLPAFQLPLLGKVHLGTPIIFDVGVYMTVVGFTLKVVFSLMEKENNEWN